MIAFWVHRLIVHYALWIMHWIKWSRRGLNPRPNRETLSFLHAYLGLCFRAPARPKPPTVALSSEFSPPMRGRWRLSPILLCHFARVLRGVSLWVTSRRSTWCRDKALIYYASIRQRERSFFRQLIVWRSLIKESGHKLSACLPSTPSCCQIHVDPRIRCYKSTFFSWDDQKKRHISLIIAWWLPILPQNKDTYKKVQWITIFSLFGRFYI